MGYVLEGVKVSDLHFAFLVNWTLALDCIGAGTEDVLTDKNVVPCMREEEEPVKLYLSLSLSHTHTHTHTHTHI